MKRKMNDILARNIDSKFDYKCVSLLSDKGDMKQWARNNRRVLRNNATTQELMVAADLEKRHIKFHTQEPIYLAEIDKVIFADFILPKGKILLEIDGNYHSKLNQRTEDLIRDAYLKARGYTVVRFGNDEVGNERYEAIIQCFRKTPENTRKAIRRILRREQREAKYAE